MDNKEKYKNKLVAIYSPSGRLISSNLFVKDVIFNNILSGKIPDSDARLFYYLDDGIRVVINGEETE